MVRPLVEISARPEPMRSASSRCLLSPVLAKRTTMTITFFGSTRLPSAASTWAPSTLTDRRYVLVEWA